MDEITIHLLNGETIKTLVTCNEEIDLILEQNGYTREFVRGISVGGV